MTNSSNKVWKPCKRFKNSIVGTREKALNISSNIYSNFKTSTMFFIHNYQTVNFEILICKYGNSQSDSRYFRILDFHIIYKLKFSVWWIFLILFIRYFLELSFASTIQNYNTISKKPSVTHVILRMLQKRWCKLKHKLLHSEKYQLLHRAVVLADVKRTCNWFWNQIINLE